ncbi:3-oxoacyl-[acyl-carrier protein] reductase [Halalkalibacter hemicellulosilyticusJCM 9152]|uniref:3-oxoacyl-[acyl-carrier protein] reductase n=1 Tax=Halalkalibacter hemicellulosilyticusJCM 9152 TaxID=1236971 RepID=W4QJC4_9BACI|nr:SDR family oxidoreductase [Halalkalibacter hemicellulosilyticus]GAE31414.1 3-oxoacyl-[acyl-carrier protein] reductase [Halalkalibacter hemicellulosilyticusJCM 9152]
MEKFAIVTGASSGFGLHITIELAKAGFTVIATMRNQSKKHVLHEAIEDPQILKRIRVTELDVTDSLSIQAFQDYIQSISPIVLFINNAGIAQAGFAEELCIDAYRQQFETNLFGVIAMTQVILPHMRTNRKGTILMMSSISGRIGFPGLSAYVASKQALEGYTESLRLELAPYNVQVAVIEPGSYQTNIWSSGLANIRTHEHSPYQRTLAALKQHIKKTSPAYGDPKEVAHLVVKLSRQEKLTRLRYPIGNGVRLTIFMKHILPWLYGKSLF